MQLFTGSGPRGKEGASGRTGETTSTRGTTGDDEEKGFSDEQVYLVRFVPQASQETTGRDEEAEGDEDEKNASGEVCTSSQAGDDG
ncbi:hypothetical protein A0H81_10354 [Grifola frondosa]|uniref:Uncharacterized protein n=1 Tax=Grifola frondosa TaxID=5627 RepID=A0A1C7LYH1_GRIFR|nr:hypothetical protein A0H81_10354 [Grifola frondosa]